MSAISADQAACPALKDMLCFALYKAHHAMNRVYKPLLGELGLTYPQYLVLIALWERDGQKVGQLGETLHLESNTLTPLLKRLEGAGLVVRRRAANDERQVMVSLTPAGKDMRKKSEGVAQCIFDALHMAPEEFRPLVSGVNAVADTLVAGRED
ncbi:MarR family transcriptional regulator [Nisaea acidiphila]|uniref:MarR family transcriptional regulator n=1 Tax=Nisaea acidiphila TaxID=1862145 RepID=A0A9J7ANE1_9PROT|nr:MarR family transcriptional regulator [Nisaea acidiphila]UUX48703.1 MarR family transcriptional regulator [Nisaea acidiphila]